MVATELKEIKDYWDKKYPRISIILYSNEAGNKFYGKMRSHDRAEDISADTIGELISQGENFLRKLNR